MKRGFVLAPLLALGLLGALGATAAGDDTTPLVSATIYSSNGASQQPDTVTLGDLSDPARCPTYSGDQLEEYGRNGQQYQANEPLYSAGQQGTWALSTILQCLSTSIDPASVTAISITGSASELTGGAQPSDLSSPSDFLDTTEQPIISYGGTAYYYRPQRTSTDLNGLDAVNGVAPPIYIQVYEGPTLSVTATASNSHPAKGASVQFTATVSPPDQNAQYAWSFQGGASTSTQQNPAVIFPNPGTFVASVQVTDPSDGAIGTGTVTVNVGSSTPQGGHHPYGGNGHHPTGPGTGPANSHGKTGTGSPGGSQPQGGGNGGNNGGSGTPGGGAGKGSATTKQPQHHAAKPAHKRRHIAASGQGGAGSNGGGGSIGSGTSGTQTAPIPSYPLPPSAFKAKATPSPTHHAPRSALKSPPANPTSLAGLIRGRLITGLDPLPLASSPFVHIFSSPQAPAPPVRAAVESSALPAIGGALFFLLVLGVGAGWELRGHRLLHPIRLST